VRGSSGALFSGRKIAATWMGGLLGARIRCGPFGAGLHSLICWSFRLSAPLRPTGSKARLCEPVFIHPAKARCFCLASLARGGRRVREDSILPTPSLRSGQALCAMKRREGWGTLGSCSSEGKAADMDSICSICSASRWIPVSLNSSFQIRH